MCYLFTHLMFDDAFKTTRKRGELLHDIYSVHSPQARTITGSITGSKTAFPFTRAIIAIEHKLAILRISIPLHQPASQGRYISLLNQDCLLFGTI